MKLKRKIMIISTLVLFFLLTGCQKKLAMGEPYTIINSPSTVRLVTFDKKECQLYSYDLKEKTPARYHLENHRLNIEGQIYDQPISLELKETTPGKYGGVMTLGKYKRKVTLEKRDEDYIATKEKEAERRRLQ